jgi:molybdopterin/thiamine biosynthesis adenylyltransferase
MPNVCTPSFLSDVEIDTAAAPNGGRKMQPVWTYDEAFGRNRGVISGEDQEKLRNSRIAIAGMGGVGGVDLITLTRLGIGKFTIADPDTFEVANFNRQYGATVSNLGRNKAEAMAEMALDINPQLDVRVMPVSIDTENIDEFLEGADLFLDGLDFFATQARRLIFQEARDRGIWSVTAGPHAYGASWLAFAPGGVSFDDYFDISDEDDEVDRLLAFAVGVVPAALHIKYLDLSRYFQASDQRAASIGAACQIASGVAAIEIAKILLSPTDVLAAPVYAQFDVFRCKLRRRRLFFCNRHPLQRLRRLWLRKMMDRKRTSSSSTGNLLKAVLELSVR